MTTWRFDRCRDDPIEHLTGIFKDVPQSMAEDLLKERAQDDRGDEKNRL